MLRYTANLGNITAKIYNINNSYALYVSNSLVQEFDTYNEALDFLVNKYNKGELNGQKKESSSAISRGSTNQEASSGDITQLNRRLEKQPQPKKGKPNKRTVHRVAKKGTQVSEDIEVSNE